MKTRRALFYKAALQELPLALPRALRVRVSRVQAKIQAFLTTPRAVVLDQQTLIGMIPKPWSAEYERCGELINTCILNDLDPENAAGDAFRDAQRERVF